MNRQQSEQLREPGIRSIVHFRRAVAPDLHDRLPRALAQNRALVVLERDLPHRLCGFGQVAHEIASRSVVQPHPPVRTTRDNEILVELQRRHRRVMRSDAPLRVHRLQRKSDDAPVGAACAEDRAVFRELHLADKRCMTLEEDEAFAANALSAFIQN